MVKRVERRETAHCCDIQLLKADLDMLTSMGRQSNCILMLAINPYVSSVVSILYVLDVFSSIQLMSQLHVVCYGSITPIPRFR